MKAQKPLIIYHGGCYDGFTAAWAALRSKGWADSDTYPARYAKGDELVELPDVDGREVLMVDFCVPRWQLIDIHERAKSFMVLDHHVTAQEACEGLDFAFFDMERSGAGLAWDVLHGEDERPWLIDYIEDRDLWNNALPDTREITAFLFAQDQDFELWDKIAKMDRNEVAASGRAVRQFVDNYVKRICKQARYAYLGGHLVPVVNAPYVMASELVGALAQGEEFAAAWFQRRDGKIQYSLRSRNGFDVSEIALDAGGGGHAAAAGFVTDNIVHVDAEAWGLDPFGSNPNSGGSV